MVEPLTCDGARLTFRALTTVEQSDWHCAGMSEGSKPVVCLLRRPARADRERAVSAARPTTAVAAAIIPFVLRKVHLEMH